MIIPIKKNIWKLNLEILDVSVYIVKIKGKTILIDTGAKENKEQLIGALKKISLTPEQIDTIILTHDHWDHIGNRFIFDKAKIYGHKKDFPKKDFPEVKDIYELNIEEFKIIETPGHSKGSFCILYKDVLFSGDTKFHNGIGRTDLSDSEPEKMQPSLNKLEKLDYKILCPGHDY
jgi:glyoxylase-like metal-dependent hydrolase (beta-lactamase superfamily II)